jgi:hypothetical protein
MRANYEGIGADEERCFIGFQDENQSSYSTVENPTIFSRTNYHKRKLKKKIQITRYNDVELHRFCP